MAKPGRGVGEPPLRRKKGDRLRKKGACPLSLTFGADFDVQDLDLAVQVAALDLEVVRRLRDVPPVLAQLAPDVLPLERRPRVPQRRIVERGGYLRRVELPRLAPERRPLRRPADRA